MIVDIKKLLKNRNVLMGIGLFFYVFLLALSVMIPSLNLGLTDSITVAFIYRSILFIFFLIITIFLFSKKSHLDHPLLMVANILFLIVNLTAIFLPYGDKLVSLDIKFIALLYLLSVIFTLFSFFEVFPKYINKKSIITFFILIDVLMLVCTIYSLIAEFGSIINAFVAKGEDAHFYQIHSFFDNKNSYGFMLFVAIIATLFLYKYFQKKWLIIPMIYFGINLVISRAKTAILLTMVLVLIYGMYKLITTYKDHKGRIIFIASIIVVFISVFLLCVFAPAIYNSSSFLSSLSNFVKEAFIGQGVRSIQARLRNLLDAGELFSNPRIILGYGEYIVRVYANTCCIVLGPIDNAYIYNLLAGGIFKTILFIYCYYLILKQVVQLTKLNNISTLYKIFIWSFEIVLLIYGMFENFQILGSNHPAIIYLLFSYSIPYLIIKSEPTKTVKPITGTFSVG